MLSAQVVISCITNVAHRLWHAACPPACCIAKVRGAIACMLPTESCADVAAKPVNHSRRTSGRLNAWQGYKVRRNCRRTGLLQQRSSVWLGDAGVPRDRSCAAPSSHGRHTVQRSCDYSRCMSMNNANVKSASHGSASTHLLQRLGSVDMRLWDGSPLNGPSSS
jgi:hypothetical protein